MGLSFALEIDGRPVLGARPSGAEATVAVRLTKGAHGVRVRKRGGSFDIDQIIVTKP